MSLVCRCTSAAPAATAAMPSATISSSETGIAGCRSRVQAPFSAASIQTLGIRVAPVGSRLSALVQRLQLVDQPGYDAEAAVPELRVAGVESKGCKQFRMVFGASGGQHVQITLGKAGSRLLVDGVERVHEAVAEGIGVDVERRVHEVRDVAPEGLVTGLQFDRRP